MADLKLLQIEKEYTKELRVFNKDSDNTITLGIQERTPNEHTWLGMKLDEKQIPQLISFLQKQVQGSNGFKQKLQIEAGKSYKLRHSKGGGDPEKLHIDYILPNSLSPDCWSCQLVVCRVWGTNRQKWFRYVYEYWQLAICNNWEYEKFY